MEKYRKEDLSDAKRLPRFPLLLFHLIMFEIKISDVFQSWFGFLGNFIRYKSWKIMFIFLRLLIISAKES